MSFVSAANEGDRELESTVGFAAHGEKWSQADAEESVGDPIIKILANYELRRL
jgi:hypothetical protein